MATTPTESVRGGAQVDWVGSLSAHPIAEVLRRIAAEERSGDLQVNLGSAIKSVYFDRGFVVFAASNLKRDRLGEGMIEAGRISRHEFALASMLMKGTKRKFGQALVQAGVISEEELGREVALQVNRIVLSLFKTKDGIYSFDERGTSIPVELMVSLSIYRILLEGIRFMTSGKLILAGLPPLNTVVRVAEQPPFTVQTRKLKPLEHTILKSARNGVPLASLIHRSEADRGHTLRSCYGLFAAGLLEPADAKRRRPLKVQEETGVFVLSEIQRKFAKIRATNAREEILMEFDRLDRVSDRELLAVDESAESASLENAFETKRTAWEKKRAMVEAQNTLVMKIDVIQERLQRAYERMAEQASPPPAEDEVPPGVPSEPILETETEDTLPPLDEELIEEVGIGLTSLAESTGSEDGGQVLSRRASDVHHAGADPRPSQVKAEVEVEVDGETSAPEIELPASVEAAASMDTAEANDGEMRVPTSAPPNTEELEREEEAVSESASSKVSDAARDDRKRQLLRDVKLHFQVRDWEHAVSLLYELVELDPTEAAHHGMLARAMARHPVMRKDAERHFIDALRLAPQDADLHYSLGLYYKSFSMHSRAQNEFRTALRIDPRHEGATKHLSAVGRGGKDPVRDMFKKIFG
jgi:tetratricopeptide (TPR) repeat protein